MLKSVAVALVGRVPVVLATGRQPAINLCGGKAPRPKPGALAYASPGNGSFRRTAAIEFLERAAGIDLARSLPGRLSCGTHRCDRGPVPLVAVNAGSAAPCQSRQRCGVAQRQPHRHLPR